MPSTEERGPEDVTEHSPLLAPQTEDGYAEVPRDSQAHARRHSTTAPSQTLNDEDGDSPDISITPKDRRFILIGVFVIGWAFGLDGLVRYTYQSYAASSFGYHSLLATINILRSVVAAAAHPPAAKIADVVGRFELIAVSVVLYVLGSFIESTASSIEVFIVGAIFYQLGYTCVILLTEVVIADVTSMRSRVFFSYVPAIPFVVNTWISGNITSAVMKSLGWRWGIGMWCIIYTVSAVPLLVSLYKAGQRGALKRADEDRRSHTRQQFISVFQQLDVVGICLAIAALGLILVPLSIAEGQVSKWTQPSIIGSLIVGCLCIPAFYHWETRYAQYPLVPAYLLRERGVAAAIAVRILLNVTWSIQGNYLYTVLVVAFDFSVTVATRITAFFTFFGVFSGLLVGLAIYRYRRLKHFIIFGTILFLVSFVLLVHFNSGASSASKLGMLCAQILLGVAAGFCAYPTQASVQAATKHEDVSVMTAIYLASFNIGSALGTCIAGAIWSETLLPTLEANLTFQPNRTLAHAIYQSPFEVVPHYPVGSEIRTAIIASYGHVEKLLCITGLVLCVPTILFAFGLKNPRLSTAQSQPEVSRREV